MKTYLKKLAVVVRDPRVRPLEVWALRVALAYVAVKLGVDVKDLAR